MTVPAPSSVRRGWRKVGRIFSVDGRYPWMKSHAQLPVVDAVSPDVLRIYFGTRDERNRTVTTYCEVSGTDPLQVLYVHDRPVLGHDHRPHSTVDVIAARDPCRLTEIVEPGAFKRSLAGDVLALVGGAMLHQTHGPSFLVAADRHALRGHRGAEGVLLLLPRAPLRFAGGLFLHLGQQRRQLQVLAGSLGLGQRLRRGAQVHVQREVVPAVGVGRSLRRRQRSGRIVGIRPGREQVPGGHIAIAWFERARSWIYARIGRADPACVDELRGVRDEIAEDVIEGAVVQASSRVVLMEGTELVPLTPYLLLGWGLNSLGISYNYAANTMDAWDTVLVSNRELPITEEVVYRTPFCSLLHFKKEGWEGQPLGPFNAKTFTTTISPWVVTAAVASTIGAAYEWVK